LPRGYVAFLNAKAITAGDASDEAKKITYVSSDTSKVTVDAVGNVLVRDDKEAVTEGDKVTITMITGTGITKEVEVTVVDKSSVVPKSEDETLNLCLTIHHANGSTTGDIVNVTKDGTYTVSVEGDFSDAQAIYIQDPRNNEPVYENAWITYKSATINDSVELTEVLDDYKEGKNPYKNNGTQFDTNDPFNAWDGSAFANVSATADNVIQFDTVDGDVTKVAVTFELTGIE
nr:hypothetical protein [Lachnospiraceae bacterium]